ncbi:membrane-bound lytic murein transglycosylase D [Corticibacter populi]|nr:membrane-bound lytic murein transglycosylase D [Corticibacter populi]
MPFLFRSALALVLTLLLAACGTLESQRSDEAALQPVIPSGALTPITPGNLDSWAVQGLQPPADLWQRLRAGFAMPDLDTDMVHDREDWYASRPEYIQRMADRSSKYLFHIVEELERRNMPTELALLPYIESAFNPQAVSHAKAAGMWQFMPATGTYFDLRQNAFRDDRRDVLASTRAALDYLQKLHDMFGDWHLALAAYNWGEGSVGRAMAKNQNLGLGVGYTDLSMPDETRMYVPKFQAVKNIIRDPAAFGVVLPDIGNHPYFDIVDIARDMDVELVAQLAGIGVDDFRTLNPSHNGPVILSAATTEVLLPWDNAQTFRRNLANHRDGRLASWTVWTTPRTMNAKEVASSLGVDEKELRSVNRIPANMLIASGSALLVPRSAATLYDVAEELAHNGQLKLMPQRQLRRTTVVARKGETVATLARRYGVAAADVAEWNKVGRNTRFKTGQRLVIYRPAATSTARASTAPKAPAQRARTRQAAKR